MRGGTLPTAHPRRGAVTPEVYLHTGPYFTAKGTPMAGAILEFLESTRGRGYASGWGVRLGRPMG